MNPGKAIQPNQIYKTINQQLTRITPYPFRKQSTVYLVILYSKLIGSQLWTNQLTSVDRSAHSCEPISSP